MVGHGDNSHSAAAVGAPTDLGRTDSSTCRLQSILARKLCFCTTGGGVTNARAADQCKKAYPGKRAGTHACSRPGEGWTMSGAQTYEDDRGLSDIQPHHAKAIMKAWKFDE